jgi:hypothetical protein
MALKKTVSSPLIVVSRYLFHLLVSMKKSQTKEQDEIAAGKHSW